MNITARIESAPGTNDVSVSTDGRVKSLAIAAKDNGRGSSVNGGELLMAALATCFCNDLYREAAKLGIELEKVHVDASAEFAAAGMAASSVRYNVTLAGAAEASALRDLVRATDAVAEIHNTVRAAIPVQLGDVTVA